MDFEDERRKSKYPFALDNSGNPIKVE